MPGRRAKVWVTVKKAENLFGSRDKAVKGALKYPAFVEVLLGKDGKQPTKFAEVGKDVDKKNATNNPVWDHACSPAELEIGDTLQLKVIEMGGWPHREVIIGVATLRVTLEMVERKLNDESLELTKIGSTGDNPPPTGTIQVSLRFESLDREAEKPTLSSSASKGRDVSSGSSAPPPAIIIPNTTHGRPLAETTKRKDNTGIVGNQNGTSQALGEGVDIVKYIYWERGLRTRKQPILCTAGVVAYLRSFCCNWRSRANNDTGEGSEQLALDDDGGRAGTKEPLVTKSLPALSPPSEF